ncbi:hypothetical protein CERSUDRAFT_116892 [Gelatoporia subvermispora B]|uniref:E3 ubiquitin-protein ligase listerin n=1 Tax=Ceriporiopsis subvermispora (strain B) TaxID=914234 RepID=M2PFJ3_CERS8|nr:hypothetical protein CERSUDRAFT_116892 [Gelatoporia subvermispora B]
MAPKGKSSATSGTRKKHARKAAGAGGQLDEPSIPKEKKPKGKDKKKGKEPRKKVYIPPVKPAPVQPDPLDTLGIAQLIPPELLVVLRRLAKKDSVTKRRALEDLQAVWVEKARTEGHESDALHALVDIIPVWLHHVPAVFLHPSRRIRLLAVGLHTSLLHLTPAIRDQIFFQLREVASHDQAEYILGAWCLAAHDVDRQVASYARESWTVFVSFSGSSSDQADSAKLVLDATLLPRIWDFIHRTILDPGGVYLYINPPQPDAPPPLPPHARKGTRPVPRKDEEPVRAKPEEEEEGEQDRQARLRIGALGAAAWLLGTRVDRGEITPEEVGAFGNTAVWSSLYYGRTPPFVPVEAFGWNQPVVRRAAWATVQTVLRVSKDLLQPILPVLSSAILRSAWVESDTNVRSVMWQPLLTFLREYPTCWELDREDDGHESDEDASSDEESGSEADAPRPRKAERKPVGPSQAFHEFLQFLELGCGGAPVQGYPAVIIILSTIPASTIGSVSLTPVDDILSAFWAAVDGRALSALDRTAASAAFLASLLECVVFLVRRVLKSPPEDAALLMSGLPAGGQGDAPIPSDFAKSTLEGQVRRVWEELAEGRLKVEGKIAAGSLVQLFKSLVQLDESLFEPAWDALARGIKAQVTSGGTSVSPLVSILLEVFLECFEPGSRGEFAAKTLVGEIVQGAIEQCEKILQDEGDPDTTRVASLVGILGTFGGSVFSDPGLAREIDTTIAQHLPRLLRIAPSLLFVYLTHRHDPDRGTKIWQDVLAFVATHPEEFNAILPALLDAAEARRLPEYLDSAIGPLDRTAGALLAEVLAGPPATKEAGLLRRILCTPGPFISESCFEGLVQSLCSSFSLQFQSALCTASISLASFDAPLALLRALVADSEPGSGAAEALTSVMPDVFLFAYLAPQFSSHIQVSLLEASRAIWATWIAEVEDGAKEVVEAVIKRRVGELLADCSVLATSEQVMQMLSEPLPGLHLDLMSDIFPSQSELDAMLDSISSAPLDPSLAIIDPLIPPQSMYEPDYSKNSAFDTIGFAKYARLMSAMIWHLASARHAAKENVWTLRHLLAFLLHAEDWLHVPYAQSPLFWSRTSKTVLKELIGKVQQLTTYLLSSVPEEGWHTPVAHAILADKPGGLDSLGRMLYDLVRHGKRKDTVRESRILHTVLQHVLSVATKEDADQWIVLARKIEKEAPQTALSILLSVTRYAPEPQRLDRYRNELAAEMLGVRPSKANTDGLWLLRRLAAVAPDPESDIIFLPERRAVNLVKACQQWITSDEDIDEDVESELTLVFFHLAPILQSVPGSHWDLIFDIMENNLENSTTPESIMLPTLERTLRLFIAVQDVASTNKALRALWESRQTTNLVFIRDIAAAKPDADRSSTPLSVCRELALQIVQDLPNSLIDETTLPKMCHLVTDSSAEVQKMAYQLLHESAKKYTENVVIEAAVDSEATMKPQLPAELIEILHRYLNLEANIEAHQQEFFGYLLGWMITFDTFTNASLKVKSGYIDQLRDLALVSDYLLPTLLTVLGLYEGIPRALKLDIWSIDEFYLDSYTFESRLSLQLLAAHVFYRALLIVPSLIRGWLVDCRDRQLFNAVTYYTSGHFSPAIVRAELDQVRTTDVTAELTDDNTTVKVASAVNEVTLSYAVDEHQLELTLKLPPDYPLHGIEIRDTKRVGVPDERWRAWVLGVQQILTFRSGSIVDGLTFFKKNISSHFEGLAECAICYSIISAMDGSLPKKPCKTCKNRFHAGCLYKWFNTSHSSSCPLCRSEII